MYERERKFEWGRVELSQDVVRVVYHHFVILCSLFCCWCQLGERRQDRPKGRAKLAAHPILRSRQTNSQWNPKIELNGHKYRRDWRQRSDKASDNDNKDNNNDSSNKDKDNNNGIPEDTTSTTITVGPLGRLFVLPSESRAYQQEI